MEYRDQIETLRAVGPIKTWSLLVTVMGDLRARPEAPLPGSLLTRLCAEMGVKPAALRVALHRLAKDGWIGSHKRGRTSAYHLLPASLAETEAVRARVYAAQVPALEAWRVLALGPAAAPPPAPCVALGPALYAVPAGAAAAPGTLILDRVGAGAAPAWVEAACLPTDVGILVGALDRALTLLEASDWPSPPLHRTALRMLILHHWRRLALRDGVWLHMALWRDGAPRRVRARVLDVLRALPAAEPDDLA